ncbi:MAG: VWA domain-containing protein [Candidatus Nanohalobium sp.]
MVEIGIGPINLILKLSQADALMLLFLIGLTTASFYLMRRMRKDRVTKLGNYQTLKEVHDSISIGSPVILAAKILLVTILFLTATESIQIEAQQPVTDVNYAITVDSSQSMLIPDYEPDRLGYVKKRLVNWVQNLPVRADLSVVSYSSQAETHALPTKDTGRIVKAIRSIEVNLNRSGTDLSAGLTAALENGNNNKKRVILVTDGRNIRDREIQQSIEIARNTSAQIYIFELPRNNQTEQLYQQLNLSLAEANLKGGVREEVVNSGLRRIAEITGGGYYEVDNSEFFQAALDDTTTKEKKLGINSNFYILIFISFFVIFEMLLYSKYGAL